MGTAVSFDIRGDVEPAAARAAIDDACGVLHAADRTFSTYRPGSVVSRLRRAELRRRDVPDEVDEVLTRCELLRVRTRGAFEHGAGAELDPSGLVKGWAAQLALGRLAAHGIEHACLNAGGDLACLGAALPAASWRVGIRDPDDPLAVAAIADVAGGGAIATSGLYERGAHLRTRPGADDATRSVSVAGPDLGEADAWATASFAAPGPAAEWALAHLPAGYAALVITADRRVLTTPGFPLHTEAPRR